VTSTVRRIVLALECDGRSEARAMAFACPVASCAGLGSVIGHVLQTLARDRHLVSSWLDQPVRTSA
jgi:hypothetical protein